ncbi:hypothetical protein ACFLWG_01225 [Chloroflexota bacterium]
MDIKELKKVTKAIYSIKPRCVSVKPEPLVTNKENSFDDDLRVNIIDKLINDELVTRVLDESSVSPVQETVIARLVSQQFQKTTKTSVFRLYKPLIAFLDYPLKAIDPDYSKMYASKMVMKEFVLYDGFVAYFGIEQTHQKINSERHVARLANWLNDALIKGENTNPQFCVTSLPHITIELYLLDTLPKGHEIYEYDEKLGLKYEGVEENKIYYSYLCNPDESGDESLNNALTQFYWETFQRFSHYYSYLFLHQILEKENSNSIDLLQETSNDYVGFHQLSSFNVVRRFLHCQNISRKLASIYTLMPNVEILTKSLEKTKEKLSLEENVNNADKITEVLLSSILERTDTIFTTSVQEMLHQEVSDVRSQINFQLLFLSAIIAFLSLLGVVIVGLIK